MKTLLTTMHFYNCYNCLYMSNGVEYCTKEARLGCVTSAVRGSIYGKFQNFLPIVTRYGILKYSII